MSAIQYQKDDQGIVELTLDKPDSPVNLMDLDFADALERAVERLNQDTYRGVILRSAKSTFFAGGDINLLYQTNQDNAKTLYAMVTRLKRALRQLETSGKPLVACLNGSALGGGFEIALAAHHRIALSTSGIQFGQPEVSLGLLPGGGGVTRITRLLGIEKALPLLSEGRLFSPQGGIQNGLIHQLVKTQDALISEAKRWILAHPEVQQPYDVKGYRIPGGTPQSPALAPKLAVAPAMIKKATKGTLPAPEAILSAMVEGTQVDFDTASEIESRYFVSLACDGISKNLINAFWYQLNQIKAGANRPALPATHTHKVGILGAGMMGAGIAWACASKGLDVVLKDVSLEAAQKGKAYSQALVDKRLAKGKLSETQAAALLNKITPVDSPAQLAGCDLIIEAVFEDRELKASVTREAEAQISPDCVFGSNTSTLPITGLAEASSRPEQFIGIHFFSPVDKMPLVEIICGTRTSPEALAKAYDFVLSIGKTPIVVNDSRGFYTSRVFSAFVQEGIAMLSETSAAEIENQAWLAGFPVGPLAVTDEVSLSLMEKIQRQTEKDLAAEGKPYEAHPSDALVGHMLARQRYGKVAGAGFYDYTDTGEKRLWPELKAFQESDTLKGQDVRDRLLFIMALETARCLEEGVLRSVGDANIGALFGLGFPGWTGGPLQFINHYGLKRFVARADELKARYGKRFAPGDWLVQRAKKQQRFEDAQ